MTGPLRVACVGAGYFSQFHYGSWARMDRVTLVGSCNRDIDGAHATGLPAYDHLQTMIEETRPDLLDIILPPVVHAETIKTALRFGVKTLICQKPFCENKAEALAMVELAKEAGAEIIIHENFRFQPWYRKLNDILRSDLVGKLHQITFRLRPGDGQGADAYMDRQPYFQSMEKFLVHETLVHWIDTFRFLLGDPIAVYADLRRMNPEIAGEDAGYVLLDHTNGVRALLDGNRHLDHAADNHRRTMGEALVEGTKGSVTLQGDGSLWFRAFKDTERRCLLPPDSWEGFGGDCVHKLQEHVVSALLDGSPLENTAQEYLKVINIEEAIYSSAETEKKLHLERL
ncbi:MAG: gfo/Idh/MocA family oxidoreductase [Boseongicola sp.]|nr:MAG: gfo/Idh/MocA family oxidoreductase [Boseongicola sp.]